MTMGLDDILSDKPAEVPAQAKEAPEQAAETVTEQVPEKPESPVERASSRRAAHRAKEFEAQGRDPATGQFAKKDESATEKKPEVPAELKTAEPAKVPEKVAAPVEEMTPREKAAFAKATDETRKRQELERQLAELRSGKPAAEPEKPKAFWDDPEGALNKHKQEIRDVATNTRLQTAEMIARSKYSDFDEKVGVFAELVQQTPSLAGPWLAAPDPAEYAYKVGKTHLELRQAGSLDELRKKIEADTEARVRSKMEAEYKAKEDEAAKQRAALVPSLSGARGGTGNAGKPVFAGPTPLEEILK